jgi:transcriptional regulator with XRE-family HTH domain
MTVVIDEASRRLLGAELRALRERAGRTVEHAAQRLECSPAKVSRIETGRVAVRPLDLRELLDCYGVGGARRAALLSVVRQQRRTEWWREYADIIHEGYDLYIGYEEGATEIWEYQPQWVPGLLQTVDYAAELAMAHGAPPHDATRYADLRRARQAILLRDDPPRLTVVIDESVLRRPSKTTGLMDDQLRHLLDVAAQPTVSVHVLPLSAGMHPAQSGAFVVLGFAPEDGRLAYTTNLTEGRLSHDDHTVGQYVAVFDRLRVIALSEEDSMAFLADAVGTRPLS